MKYSTPVADVVRVHEISRAAYTIDTVNGQPLVDLIVEVEDKTGSSQASTGPGKYLNAWFLLESAPLAVPRSVGLAVFWGLPTTRKVLMVPPAVRGSWLLPAVWDPRFSWDHRQPATPRNRSTEQHFHAAEVFQRQQLG